VLFEYFQICRPVYCPGGMRARVRQDPCSRDSGLIANAYNVCLNLTFTPSVTVEALNYIMDVQRGSFLQLWNSGWTIGQVFYKSENNHIVYAVAKISTSSEVFRSMHSILSEVNINLGSSRQIMYNKTTINVRQQFSRYCLFVIFKRPTNEGRIMVPRSLYQLFLEGSLFSNITDHFYRMIRGRFVLKSKFAVILTTKLSFCKQVEISTTEAILVASGAILHINNTNVYLFENEFVVSMTADQTQMFRVCLEDSYLTNTRVSLGHRSQCVVAIILAFVIMAKVFVRMHFTCK